MINLFFKMPISIGTAGHRSLTSKINGVRWIFFLINAGTKAKIEAFVIKIKSFRSKLNTSNAYELAEEIAKSSGIFHELNSDKTPEGIVRFCGTNLA